MIKQKSVLQNIKKFPIYSQKTGKKIAKHWKSEFLLGFLAITRTFIIIKKKGLLLDHQGFKALLLMCKHRGATLEVTRALKCVKSSIFQFLCLL